MRYRCRFVLVRNTNQHFFHPCDQTPPAQSGRPPPTPPQGRAMGDKAALAALGIAEAPPKAAPPEPSGPHFTSAAEDPKRVGMRDLPGGARE